MPDQPHPDQHPVLRALRVATALAGVGLIGYGIHGLLHDSYITDPTDILWWAAGGLVLHDGLWLPLVCLLGLAAARTTPVRSGLVLAAAVTAVALPAVLRAGDDHGNPTVLALPYLRNWLLTLAAVAVLTTVWELLRRRRARR
ncbi:hypothetical protein ACFW1A_37450 [Kitasatospora sp. NPDC058965]|uniref:hypothetical protein n=1 Tax=Kitasatospora sp. NPDC058965 TaxID=3346682 RepID=UPI0036A2A7BB